jgi:hypothetical protein
MVKRDDRMFSESMEIGRANQRLLPHLKRWCRHIDAEMTSYGMLAQATGLPIGHLKVTCPHGHTLSESAHLNWEANSFILNNCIGCPHHDEVSPDNYGREVLAERARRELESKEAETRRKQLKAQAYEAAANALKTGRPTEESVNRFILDLFGTEEEAARSRDLLVQAAGLGPECFSDAALRVLADAFIGQHTESCIEAARVICRHRKAVPDTLITAALETVGQGCDAACGLLSDSINYGQDVAPILSALPAIVKLPDYGWFRSMVGAVHVRPTYPSTLELVQRLFEADSGAVRAALAARLKNPEKMVRFNAIELMSDLLPQGAEAILPLAGEILRSLELPDDIYHGCSADGSACQFLAHLYAHSPDEVETRIQAFLPGATQDARVLVLDVYSRLALLGIDEERHRWADSRGFLGFDQVLYARHALSAIDRHLLALGDLDLPPDKRHQVCDHLKRLIKRYPEAGLARIERILGRLSMTVREARNTPAPTAGMLAAMEAHGRASSYAALNRTLTEIVEELAQASPQSVFPAVRDLLDRLGSKDEAEAELKAQLVTTLTSFADTYDLVPAVIRQLYKHLVDFESWLVRARAICVAGDLLSDIPQSVPDDIVELLTVYLSDRYFIIRQNATKALGSLRFQRDERGVEVLNCLIQIERYYRQEAKDFHFLREAFDVLRRSFREWPEVKRYVAVKLLPQYVLLPDRFFAEDMLVLMGEQIEAYPELIPTFVQAALNHLKSTARDRYNDDTHTDRGKVLNRLRQVPASALVAELARVRDVIRSKVGHDPLEVIRLLETLSHKELHAEAATLAQEALSLVPDVKSRRFERETYAAIQAAERAESLVIEGRCREAVEVIELVGRTPEKPDTDT